MHIILITHVGRGHILCDMMPLMEQQDSHLHINDIWVHGNRNFNLISNDIPPYIKISIKVFINEDNRHSYLKTFYFCHIYY